LTNKIIVLGGSGFLGSSIIEGLSRVGFKDITCGDIVNNASLNVPYTLIDLLDVTSTSKILSSYDLVINCTGQVSEPFNLCFELNSTGTFNLAQALSNYSTRVIHISSVSVYGSGRSCNEASKLNPETNYATAKAFAEKILAHQINPANLSILRLSNLYGAAQGKGIIAYLTREYHSDRQLKFNNAGDLIRYYLHIDDCVSAIVKIVKDDSLTGIYNVVGEAKFTIKELISLIEKRFNMTYDTEFISTSPWENIEDLSAVKLKEATSFQPDWRLSDYIDKELER